MELGRLRRIFTCSIGLERLFAKSSSSIAVSYTHLDVYKRQVVFCIGNVSIPTKASIYNVVGEVAVSAGAAVAPQAAHIDVKNIIALVYCIGIVVLALWYLTVFVVHRVRMSRLERITDEVTLGILRELISELSIRENITLRRGKTAQTLGRTVILPDGYTPDEQRQILLHELCHYRNRDNAKLVNAAAMMCLNWFNPFMWFSFRRFRADVEMYCDCLLYTSISISNHRQFWIL